MREKLVELIKKGGVIIPETAEAISDLTEYAEKLGVEL